MTHPIAELSERVRSAVRVSLGEEHASAEPAVHRSAFADYQADVALRLARAVRRPPLELAKQLVGALDVADLCSEVFASPPGFINFKLKKAALEAYLLEVLRDSRGGVPRASAPETIVIDYSGPNAAKEMHVGHLRSAVIGDALARILDFAGHRVIRQNHIGDWGTQFGMLVEHLLEAGADGTASELEGGALNAFYQSARRKFDSDPSFADRARARVVLLQAGDPQTLVFWQTLIDASRAHFRAVYAKLGVLLVDRDQRGESFYNPFLPEVASELERLGVARVDQGALCVFLPEFTGREGDPLPLIVRKQDGGYGYATTDLAAVRFRVNELGATRLLYVVGAPQQQHLAMVFATARRAGWLPDSVRAEHIAFGSVLGEDRKVMRTRSGENPPLLDLLAEAADRAGQAVREKNPELPPDLLAKIADAVGVGALKYADLSTERIKDYVFDWSRMLSFEGNTGPYLQYAHARIASILRRAADNSIALAAGLSQGQVPEGVSLDLGAPAEHALALELLDLSQAVESVQAALQPHKLCVYLYQLASKFTAFYESCPVLKAETKALRDSRLLLSAATRQALGLGLGLLGMDAPDRM